MKGSIWTLAVIATVGAMLIGASPDVEVQGEVGEVLASFISGIGPMFGLLMILVISAIILSKS